MKASTASPLTPHSTHDLLLLAAAADRDPDPATRAAADEQIARCAECAALAADLRALAAGLDALPASMPAPRDMRLSAEQAARLRRGRLWRRLLRPFGADGLPALRPLAAVLTTLGLAGILLTSIPLGLGGLGLGGAASAPQLTSASPAGGGTGSESYDGAAAPGSSERTGTPARSPGTVAGPASSPDDQGPVLGGADRAKASQDTGTLVLPEMSASASLPPLTLVSIGLLAAGLGLFAILVLARRVA